MIVNAKHPEYSAREQVWLFNTVSYLGDQLVRQIATSDALTHRVLSSTLSLPTMEFLWRHERESTADYNRRASVTAYKRVAGQVADQLVAACFEGVMAPTIPASMPEEWLDDVDGAGTSWTRLLQDVATWCLTQGSCHVLADLPAQGDETREPGVPYLCVIPPLGLLDWVIDRRGRLTFARVQENSVTNAHGITVQAYREWTPETVRVFADAKLVSETPNPFGRVPIETVYFDRDPTATGPVGRAWIDTPARLNQELFNADSWVISILRTVTFPILALPTPEGVTQVETTQELSSTVALGIPAGGQVPSWIVPDRAAVDVIKDHAKSLMLEIRQLGGFYTDSESTQGVQSAEALHLKRATLDALLGTLGRNLADGATRIGRLACEIAGWEPREDFVQMFPESYGDEGAGVRLEELAQAKDLGLPPKAMAVLKKSAVRTTFPQLEADVLAELDAEIDAAVVEEAAREKAREDRANEVKAAMMQGKAPMVPAEPEDDVEAE